MKMKIIVSWYSLLLIGISARGADSDAVLERVGTGAGVAVHLGTTDGVLEATLTNDGSMLVLGLALSNEARDRARKQILSQGLYGLASVSTWRDRSRLPYATNLINVLVADLDALGSSAPPMAEIERVVAPFGIMLVQKNGQWTRKEKPRPGSMDDWGHFDHGANGDGTSRDQLVTPVRQQQWLTSLQGIPETGNPAAYEPGAGVRIAGRYLVMEANDNVSNPNESRWILQARDAFNGTPLWALTREDGMPHGRWAFAAADGNAYAWLTNAGDLHQIDLSTGTIKRTFPGTAMGDVEQHGEEICVRVAGEYLVVGLCDRLLCFNVSDGTQRWRINRDGLDLLAPVLDIKRGRVYAMVSRKPLRKGRAFRGRWPVSTTVKSIIALDLMNGELAWECNDVASVPIGTDKEGKPVMRNIGQLVPGDDHLIAFGSTAIGGGKMPFLGAIDIDTGRLASWSDAPFKRNYNVASYNVIWRDGAAWFAGAFTNLWRYDPSSGEVAKVLSMSWNQRCTRFAATPNWFLFGQAAYFGPDFAGEQVSVGRSGCALPNTPANGMTYFTPTACRCTTLVRGFQAMTGELASPRTSDVERLVTVKEPPLAPPFTTALPAGPIAGDWLKQQRSGIVETEPVSFADLAVVAVVQQHRLEARRDGKPVWTILTGARVSSPPIVVDQLAIFGSHDGWVYAADPEGQLQWKYFLAPIERLIGINGQLESSWPVFGVVFLEGKVIASAGTHVELGGGVTIAALDPSTGQPAWVKRLQKHPSPIPVGGKGAKVASYSFTNSVPRIVGGRITLGNEGRRNSVFTFAPTETESSLNARLNAPPSR